MQAQFREAIELAEQAFLRDVVAGRKVNGFTNAEERAAGMTKVVPFLLEDAGPVLADGYWSAKKGRDALQVDWDLGPNATFSRALRCGNSR